MDKVSYNNRDQGREQLTNSKFENQGLFDEADQPNCISNIS